MYLRLLVFSSFFFTSIYSEIDTSILDAYMEKGRLDWEVPGVAIAIVKDNTVIYSQGYGVKTLGEEDPIDENTLFAIASCSKAFTATALGMLVDEGKITFEDRVNSLIPEFELYDPFITREINFIDLLSHRSGIDRHDLVAYKSSFDSQEIMYRIRFMKPSASFRAHWYYNNLMYMVAGEVIPRLEGISWNDFVKARIFAPLGMNTSLTTVSDLSISDNYATPHAKIRNTVRTVNWVNIDPIAPAGAIISNVKEMAEWLKLHINSGTYQNTELLSKKTCDLLHSPHSISGKFKEIFPESDNLYGLGWFIENYQGQKLIHHGGNIDGMSSLVAFLPKEKLGVVILTNMQETFFPYAVMYQVFDMYLEPESPKDWDKYLQSLLTFVKSKLATYFHFLEMARQKNTQPSAPFAAFCGSYENEVYGRLDLEEDNDGLFVKFAGFEGKLTHWENDTFLLEIIQNTPHDLKCFLKFTQNGGNIVSLEVKIESVIEAIFHKS